MGSFYTNITLREPDQDAVAALMESEQRTACIAPAGAFTVVYDRDTESQDDAILCTLTALLSRRFQCAALAVLNHDDDILAYWLYENGRRTDQYNSAPDYFTAEDEPEGPEGGDAAVLCRALGADPAQAEAVEQILRVSVFDDDGYVFASERHADLADALGLPECAVGFGYVYLERGELPRDLEFDDLRWTGD